MHVRLHQLKLHEAQKMSISSYFNLYKVDIKLSHGNDSLDKIVQQKILNHPLPESEPVWLHCQMWS